MAMKVNRVPGGGSGPIMLMLIIFIVLFAIYDSIGRAKFWTSVITIIVSAIISLAISSIIYFIKLKNYRNRHTGGGRAMFSVRLSPEYMEMVDEEINIMLIRAAIFWVILSVISLGIIFLIF